MKNPYFNLLLELTETHRETCSCLELEIAQTVRLHQDAIRVTHLDIVLRVLQLCPIQVLLLIEAMISAW